MEEQESPQSEIQRWYASLYTRRVDLVGDYAGAELFLIEGDSLLLQAFSDPLLDFGANGFQLLHAVYNVEKFLKQLSARGGNFHIAFFDDRRELCVPDRVGKKYRQKFLLARDAVLRHLKRNVAREVTEIKTFESATGEDFLNYIHDAGCYFVMCHDGTGQQLDKQEYYQWWIHFLAQSGWNVALVNGLECQDTKVRLWMLREIRVATNNALDHDNGTGGQEAISHAPET